MTTQTKSKFPQILTDAQATRLIEPTPAQAIRQHKGAKGRMVSYLTQQYVTQLLNEVFGFDWDFNVVWEQVGKEEVIVKCRLTIRSGDHAISKTQFGGVKIKRDQSGKALSVSDDLKAAASDALKKCASLLGVGLDLYDSPPNHNGRYRDTTGIERDSTEAGDHF